VPSRGLLGSFVATKFRVKDLSTKKKQRRWKTHEKTHLPRMLVKPGDECHGKIESVKNITNHHQIQGSTCSKCRGFSIAI